MFNSYRCSCVARRQLARKHRPAGDQYWRLAPKFGVLPSFTSLLQAENVAWPIPRNYFAL